jgi:hypothetical protein
MVRFGAVRCGVAGYGSVGSGVVWYGIAVCLLPFIWSGVVGQCPVWHGAVWFGPVGFGMDIKHMKRRFLGWLIFESGLSFGPLDPWIVGLFVGRRPVEVTRADRH